MADFAVTIERIRAIHPIEGADRIVAAQVGDFLCVVLKDEYKPGDLVAYIPEQALVPDWLLEEMGLVGKLAGPNKNRVKAIKLKGTLSQGLVYPFSRVLERIQQRVTSARSHEEAGELDHVPNEGDDVSEILGIVKYEPPIPAHFSGKLARPRGDHDLLKYDIENIKKYPDLIAEGEEVEVTEKIHGTLMQSVYWPVTDQFAVSSKGLGARGFIIEDNEANANNVYIRTAKQFGLADKMRLLHRFLKSEGWVQNDTPIVLLGEVFGQGVQDLTYATELGFRVFDIYIGQPPHGFFLNPYLRRQFTGLIELQSVPVLYEGKFSKQVLDELTSGPESVSGQSHNIREGVVVKPLIETIHPRYGRVALKSVSPDYLLRKGGTEFN